MKKLLLASTSTLFGESYLSYLLPEIKQFFSHCSQVLFIPYAQPGGCSLDAYTQKVADTFSQLSISVTGLHTYTDKKSAITQAEAIFVGGGNTFLLLKTLYDLDLMDTLKDTISNGTPYLGCSAGSNLAGFSIHTTNDMPIVYPPSFQALGMVNFCLNPHYLDPIPNLKHNGETRETRIIEYLTQQSIPVVGLREGSWLQITGESVTLHGKYSARIFKDPHQIYELPSLSKIEL